MSLIRRLLVIAGGLMLAFYALSWGPALSPVRLAAVVGDVKAVSSDIIVALAVAGLCTAVTASFAFLNFLRNIGSKRISYLRVLWTMALLIADATFIGMLLQPDTAALSAWLWAGPTWVIALATIVLLPTGLMLVELIVTISIAADRHYGNTAHSFEDKVDNLQEDLNRILLQLGWVENNGEWKRPQTTAVEKIITLLHAVGCSFDNDKKVWLEPDGAEFKQLNSRLDGAFAHFKRMEESVAELQRIAARYAEPAATAREAA